MADSHSQQAITEHGKSSLSFLLDSNLGLKTDEIPLIDVLPAYGITVEGSTDLPNIDQRVAAHEPDLAYIPSADFSRLLRKGDRYYVGLAIPTSKFSGLVSLPSVLVVRKDDPATGFDDLKGATYGYINRSCTSSYFPAAVMLAQRGKDFKTFLDMKPVKAWQGQIDAVVGSEVRATMCPEDVWRTTPENNEKTKIIGRYDNAKPALVVVRHDLDEGIRKAVLDAIVAWVPKWDAVYGCFKPFYRADVHSMFHDIDQLPADA